MIDDMITKMVAKQVAHDNIHSMDPVDKEVIYILSRHKMSPCYSEWCATENSQIVSFWDFNILRPRLITDN
jgi:hypothetical protein